MNEIIDEYLHWKKLKRQSKGEISTIFYTLKRYRFVDYKDWPQVFHKWSVTVSDTTINSTYRRIRAFCNWCIERGYVDEVITKQFIRPSAPKLLPKTLTKDQVNLLLAACRFHSQHAYVVFSTYLRTGMRKTELLKLEPHHVILTEGNIFVSSGKGKKDRLIPISDELLYLLKHWKFERKDHPYFFNLYDTTLKRMKKEIQDDLKFHFTVHMLRHTFGTMMVREGADLLAVKDIMGHSDIKTTMGYLSSSTEHMRSQIDKLSF